MLKMLKNFYNAPRTFKDFTIVSVRSITATLFTLSLFFIGTVCVAGGDHAGEAQPPPPSWMKIPPAPPLPVEEALKTFKLQPGFHLEVVASDPLVHDPIAIAFDPDGRIYVVEYRGYMPNADGVGEDQPVGSVTLLEDTDGDGRMDKRTEYLSNLVMPRAIGLSNGGVLIAEPPALWFCRDKKGEGKSTVKIQVASDYGSQASPEHTANGLLYGLDNWIYNANYPGRFRWKDRLTLGREPTTPKGQWGITQDDWGRLYFNSNSNLLFADFIPSHYFFRNPFFQLPNKEMVALGVGVEIVKDQTVYSSRVNPGVNRGYQKNTLRDDGRLDKVTATCGPGVYRGDNFPAEYKGNVFIPEPSANLIKRELITETGTKLSGKSAYVKDEFLTSTDERFRPVNVYTGPDGCLYIVDLYRGILQHKIYLTTYLKKQSIERELDKYNGMGRIYRVVADGQKPGPKPQMSKETPEELVKHLSHPNGWWRDTAQRLLVESKDESVIPSLRKLAATPEPETSLGRLHALWTLEGLGGLDVPTIQAALTDPRPKIRANAVRVSESLLKAPAPASGETAKPFTPPQALLDTLKELAAKNTDDGVRVQLMLSLSDVQAATAEEIVDSLLKDRVDDPAIRGAAISGLGGRELEFLQREFSHPEWAQPSEVREVKTAEKDGKTKSEKIAGGKQLFINSMAGCVMRRKIGERIANLLDLAAEQTGQAEWRATEILRGMVANGPKNGRRVKLATEPASLKTLLASSDKAVKDAARGIDAMIKWPNRAGMEPEPPPLSGEHLASFERGKEVYKLCAECHHPQGWGIEGKAPPLVDSEWALGTEQRTIRMVLNGMAGPKHIGDAIFNSGGTLEMPGMGTTLKDQQIADVLTYIRREWENYAPQVKVETVTEIRAKEKDRESHWTEKELNDLIGQRVPVADKKKKPK